MYSLEELQQKAHQVRKDVVDICCNNGAGHIAPSLSCIDILVSLYYEILNRSDDPAWEDRDRLVFSKAHGCYGLYSILSDIGYLKRQEWENFYIGSSLSGCIERNVDIGLEAGTGSLGHGLPMAVGIAFGAKMKNKSTRSYCIVGDGEMQEGSNWEAVQFAVKHKLSNLIVIVDRNGLQAMDFLENILTPQDRKDDLDKKFSGFGCNVKTCDGHNIDAINTSLKEIIEEQKKNDLPYVLIADTTKGYGLTCMENVAKFHFRLPTEEELEQGKRYE